MAHAGRKQIGRGAQPKGSGVGATTEIQKDLIEEHEVLSNRDKSRHPKTRGLDGKAVQADQYQDTAANRLSAAEETPAKR